MKNEIINAQTLLSVLSDTLTDLDSQDVRESNRNFMRQIAKAKEIGNIAGKMIALTGQQLYAIELGANIEVNLLGIQELQTGKKKLIEKVK